MQHNQGKHFDWASMRTKSSVHNFIYLMSEIFCTDLLLALHILNCASLPLPTFLLGLAILRNVLTLIRPLAQHIHITMPCKLIRWVIGLFLEVSLTSGRLVIT